MKTPDAILRGIAVHDILEKFVRDATEDPSKLTHAHLMDVSDHVLAKEVPWATARTLYRSRIERVANHILKGERARRAKGKPIAYEREAAVDIPMPPMRLTGKADRIDRITDGRLVIYDYKTGKPPGPTEQQYFDKQLLLEAAMAEKGASATSTRRRSPKRFILGFPTIQKMRPHHLRKHQPHKSGTSLSRSWPIMHNKRRGIPHGVQFKRNAMKAAMIS